MSASCAGEPAVFAGGLQAVCDSATRLGQPTQKQSIPESQIQGIQENHRVRNGDMPAGLEIPGSLFSASSSHQVGQHQNLLKRKRGKHGPDSRISPMEQSAITEAIRTSTSRKGQPVFLPAVGMKFNSAKEAKDFYNLYSWEIGFGIRRGRNKTNGNNYITRQDFVCSCEGLNKREATCRRTGCKAMVRLHRTSDHGWVISRFEMQHNHPCSATNGPNKQWPSHSDIDLMTKDVVRKLRENNRPIERVCTGQDDDTRTFPEAGGLSPTQMSVGMEEVLGTSGLDTVAPKEARPLCELERSLCIQRMATPVPVEMEQPLAFSSGGDGDGDREDEENAKEDEEAPYEESEDHFPGMSGRRRPTEEEMDPNYILDDEPPAAMSGGTRVLRRRKWPLPTETEMDDSGRSSAPSACFRPDRRHHTP